MSDFVFGQITNNKLSRSINDYITDRKANDDTVMYYLKYCEMVEILLDSIKADREGNFDLHISSVR